MKKKVLIYSISYFPFVGGAEIALKEITDRMSEIEWILITCVKDRTLPREEKIGSVLVHRIACPKILFPFFAFFLGRRIHTREHVDVVWSMMTYAGFPGLFMKIAFPQLKFLLTLQEGTPFGDIARKSSLAYPLLRLMFVKADMIQAISNFLARMAQEMGSKREVIVVPNGVDLSLFAREPDEKLLIDISRTLGKNQNDVYLVTTSRLSKKNAVDDVIKALQFLPKEISFLIIGIGEDEQYLRTLAHDCGVRDRVRFLGFIDHIHIPPILYISDIFVRASRSEGFGNSFIEAMATGLPVVATPVGGIPDFIDDGETGIFTSPSNPKVLAQSIIRLLGNEALFERISRQGRERVIERYGWDTVVASMKERVFSKLLYNGDV